MRTLVLGLALTLGACTAHGVGTDAALPTADASTSADGTPTRVGCVSTFGNGLTASHGRLDGFLVAVVPPTRMRGCNADDSHVHLQVKMQGDIYDVAVDIGSTGDDIFAYATDLPNPGGPWFEGWHSDDALSYAALGISSTMFTMQSPTDAPASIDDALAAVNHISVFGTGYNANGMHLVHYEGGQDGAIVTSPQAATSHLLLFRFPTDRF